MAEQTGPLSAVQIDELIQRIRDLNAADIEIENAGRAGLDVTAARLQSANLRRQLMQLKSVYAPARSI